MNMIRKIRGLQKQVFYRISKCKSITNILSNTLQTYMTIHYGAKNKDWNTIITKKKKKKIT